MAISSRNHATNHKTKICSSQLGQTGLTGRGNRSDRLKLGQPFCLGPHHLNLSLSLPHQITPSPSSPTLSRAAPLTPNPKIQIPHCHLIQGRGKLQVGGGSSPCANSRGEVESKFFVGKRLIQGKQARVGSISFSR